MTGTGGFVPYIEASDPRPHFPTSHTSGSDTSAIDHMRQGIEITTDNQRYGGAIPLLGSGEEDNHIEIVVFGQSQEFKDNVAFEELVVFDPLLYIQNQSTLIFPIILDNASFENPETLGGFIEPLSLGSRNSLLSITEFEAHGVKGSVQNGNEDSFKKSDSVIQIIAVNERQQLRNLYVDSQATVGASSSISLPGYSPNDETLIDPFNESQVATRAFTSGVLNAVGSPELRRALLLMTGSSTDDYVQFGYKSQGTGMVFGSNLRGTDSIAFGDLKR